MAFRSEYSDSLLGLRDCDRTFEANQSPRLRQPSLVPNSTRAPPWADEIRPSFKLTVSWGQTWFLVFWDGTGSGKEPETKPDPGELNEDLISRSRDQVLGSRSPAA